jgi:hypothetical protein
MRHSPVAGSAPRGTSKAIATPPRSGTPEAHELSVQAKLTDSTVRNAMLKTTYTRLSRDQAFYRARAFQATGIYQ